MKLVRVLLICVGVVVVLVLVALGVALNSSVQTWAARRALASQPEVKATVGTVSAGFQRVELRDLHYETRGAVLTLPSVEMEVPLAPAALAKKISIHRLVAKGWILDLTHAAKLAATLAPLIERSFAATPPPPHREFSLLPGAYAAETSAAAPVFRGVFAGLELPVDLSMDGVDLDGEIVLPPLPGHETVRLRLTVRGGGLGVGAEGTFVVDLAGAKPSGGALSLHGTLAAAMDTPRTFSRFGAKIAVEASGPQLPAGVKLNVDTSAARSPSGESYALLLAGEGKQLADVKAQLVSATSQISGTWKLNLRDRDLTPFAVGRELPVFSANGEGSFETTAALESVHASGKLTASADQLARVRAELGAIGAMTLNADFDVLHHGDSLRVEKLDATLAGAAPVLSVHALQSFEFDLRTAALQVADPARDLVGLSLAGVPLAWARPVLGGLTVAGGDVRGEFVVSARDGGLALRPTTPLTMGKISLTRAGLPLVQEVDIKVTASADYTPQGWQVQANDFVATHAGATLLTLNARAGQLAGADKAIKAEGKWTADLAALMSQPAIASQLQLASGAVSGDFAGSIDGTKSLEANLALTKLAVASGEDLPAITLQLRADVAADGSVVFKAPLLLARADRKSDLLLAGTLKPGTPASTLDARITGDQVFVDDVQVLTVLIPAPATAAEPAPGSPSAGSGQAFWSAVNGQASLALKKVVYGANFEITDVAGTLRLDPATVKLEGVRALFGPESNLKLNAAMKFDPKAKEHYAGDAEIALNNFDTAPAFRALNPAKSPTLETRLNISGNVTSSAESVDKLADRARGHFELTSKGGTFRGLAMLIPADKLQTAQSALSMVSGLFGGSSAGETAKSVSEVVTMLAEIPFDQLSVNTERDADLNLLLKDFNLISPNVRLGGEGLVKYTPDQPLLKQALDLKISLGARGRLGELLGQLKLLKAEKDALGYTAFVTPIKVGGTLEQTNADDLKTKLINLAVEKSGIGDVLNRLRGGGK